MVEQLVIYAVLGLALDAAGQDWTKPLFWCILALVMLSNYLARKEGFEEGIEVSQDILHTAVSMLDQAKELDSKNDNK